MSNEESNKDKVIIERYAEAQETKVSSPDQVTSYYYDEKGQEPIPESDLPDVKIDIKMTDATLTGESRSAEFYVKNNLERNIIELIPYSLDKHVSFSEYPKELKPQEIGLMRLTFSPSYKRLDGLKTNWGFNYVLRVYD
jgi:hypothetical protein